MQAGCSRSRSGDIQRTETACLLSVQPDTNPAAVLSTRAFIEKQSQIEESKMLYSRPPGPLHEKQTTLTLMQAGNIEKPQGEFHSLMRNASSGVALCVGQRSRVDC